eukprot:6491679-Amphidinium_carterae.1
MNSKDDVSELLEKAESTQANPIILLIIGTMQSNPYWSQVLETFTSELAGLLEWWPKMQETTEALEKAYCLNDENLSLLMSVAKDLLAINAAMRQSRSKAFVDLVVLKALEVCQGSLQLSDDDIQSKLGWLKKCQPLLQELHIVLPTDDKIQAQVHDVASAVADLQKQSRISTLVVACRALNVLFQAPLVDDPKVLAQIKDMHGNLVAGSIGMQSTSKGEAESAWQS